MLVFFWGAQFVIIASMIVIILLQRSNTDAVGHLSGGGHGVFSDKTSTSFIVKFTFFLAFLFMANALYLAKMTVAELKGTGNIMTDIVKEEPQTNNPETVVPLINKE